MSGFGVRAAGLILGGLGVGFGSRRGLVGTELWSDERGPCSRTPA